MSSHPVADTERTNNGRTKYGRGNGVSPVVAGILDLVLIVVFAAIGRSAHHEDWTGAFVTAWPFLTGGLFGWLVWAVLRRSAPTGLTGGLVVWVATVAGGMIVRQLTGQGTHWSFIIVALIATAILLFGWRLIAGLVTTRRATH